MDTLIPASCYHEASHYALEQEHLFRRTWQAVAFRRDLAIHQDFVTREVAGLPVVIQNFHGELRAFINVCSHRFNRIQTLCRGNRPLQCAYHGWTFDAQGLPCAIPKRPRFDGLTPEKLQELRLTSWRVEVCGELVFVVASEETCPLREFLGDAYATVEQMTLACGPRLDENVMEIEANWKVLVENTLESYHVSFVHANTFSRLGLAEGRFDWQGPHSSWQAPLNPSVLQRLARFEPAFASRAFQPDGYIHQLIFPNLTLASTRGTSISVQFFEPLSPSRTRFTSVVFQAKLKELDHTEELTVGAVNQSTVQFNRSVFQEDKDVCEQVQRGVVATRHVGVLSDEELRVQCFQGRYLEQVRR